MCNIAWKVFIFWNFMQNCNAWLLCNIELLIRLWLVSKLISINTIACNSSKSLVDKTSFHSLTIWTEINPSVYPVYLYKDEYYIRELEKITNPYMYTWYQISVSVLKQHNILRGFYRILMYSFKKINQLCCIWYSLTWGIA